MSAAGNRSENGSGGKRTLVEEGAEFRGVLTSRHPVLVMGTVEGDVSGPAVEVSETGVVAGKLRVGELRSKGEIAGDIQADHVRLGGRVRDKTVLRAKSLEVEAAAPGSPAATQFGECELEVGDAVDKGAIIAAAVRSRAEPPAAASSAAAASSPAARAPAGAAPAATMPTGDTDETDLPAAVAREVNGEGSAALARRNRKGIPERTA
jgi:cytoskeletal protein CcmA (bactofilin family)